MTKYRTEFHWTLMLQSKKGLRMNFRQTAQDWMRVAERESMNFFFNRRFCLIFVHPFGDLILIYVEPELQFHEFLILINFVKTKRETRTLKVSYDNFTNFWFWKISSKQNVKLVLWKFSLTISQLFLQISKISKILRQFSIHFRASYIKCA